MPGQDRASLFAGFFFVQSSSTVIFINRLIIRGHPAGDVLYPLPRRRTKHVMYINFLSIRYLIFYYVLDDCTNSGNGYDEVIMLEC